VTERKQAIRTSVITPGGEGSVPNGRTYPRMLWKKRMLRILRRRFDGTDVR